MFHMWFSIYVIFYSANLNKVEKVDYKQLIGKLTAHEGSRSQNDTKITIVKLLISFS